MTGCCAHVVCVSICDKPSHMYSQLLGDLRGERSVWDQLSMQVLRCEHI